MLIFTGCATTGARIQAHIDEKPEVFAKPTRQQQKDSRWGYVRLGFNPIKDQTSADIYSNIDAAKDLPTIWVAFKDNVVVNVQRFGDHQGTADKTGSLGG